MGEPRMRAENLGVIRTEGEGGQGNSHNNKQHKDAETQVASVKLMTATTGTER